MNDGMLLESVCDAFRVNSKVKIHRYVPQSSLTEKCS